MAYRNRLVIAALDREAQLYGDSTLIVSLPDRCECVHSNDPIRLERLQRLRAEGGIPAGFVWIEGTAIRAEAKEFE